MDRLSVETFLHCPISLEVMQDPVRSLCGHLFERGAIEGYLLQAPPPPGGASSARPCPICRRPVQASDLTPDFTIRGLCERLLESWCSGTSTGSQVKARVKLSAIAEAALQALLQDPPPAGLAEDFEASTVVPLRAVVAKLQAGSLDKLHVVLMGRTKSGKSTLGNSLISLKEIEEGKPVLPILPTSDLAQTHHLWAVEPNDSREWVLETAEGKQTFPRYWEFFREIQARFTRESGAPARPEAELQVIRLRVPVPIPSGAVLTDSPGVSEGQFGVKLAAYMKATPGIALYVLNGVHGGLMNEDEFILHQLPETAPKIFTITHVDQIYINEYKRQLSSYNLERRLASAASMFSGGASTGTLVEEMAQPFSFDPAKADATIEVLRQQIREKFPGCVIFETAAGVLEDDPTHGSPSQCYITPAGALGKVQALFQHLSEEFTTTVLPRVLLGHARNLRKLLNDAAVEVEAASGHSGVWYTTLTKAESIVKTHMGTMLSSLMEAVLAEQLRVRLLEELSQEAASWGEGKQSFQGRLKLRALAVVQRYIREKVGEQWRAKFAAAMAELETLLSGVSELRGGEEFTSPVVQPVEMTSASAGFQPTNAAVGGVAFALAGLEAELGAAVVFGVAGVVVGFFVGCVVAALQRWHPFWTAHTAVTEVVTEVLQHLNKTQDNLKVQLLGVVAEATTELNGAVRDRILLTFFSSGTRGALRSPLSQKLRDLGLKAEEVARTLAP